MLKVARRLKSCELLSQERTTPNLAGRMTGVAWGQATAVMALSVRFNWPNSLDHIMFPFCRAEGALGFAIAFQLAQA
jgi:hypothetical protein